MDILRDFLAEHASSLLVSAYCTAPQCRQIVSATELFKLDFRQNGSVPLCLRGCIPFVATRTPVCIQNDEGVGMQSKLFGSSATTWLAAGIGIASAAYATYVGLTWLRFGRPKPTTIENE